jgi:hypothetical protein
MSCEPSPPTVITASMPSFFTLGVTSSEMSRTTSCPFSTVLYWKGFARLVVLRMVPPRARMPLTLLSVSSHARSGQIRPSKPSGTAMTFPLYFRMAGFDGAGNDRVQPGGVAAAPVPTPIQRMSHTG